MLSAYAVIPPYGEGTRHLIDDVTYGPILSQLKFAATTMPRNVLARFR